MATTRATARAAKERAAARAKETVKRVAHGPRISVKAVEMTGPEIAGLTLLLNKIVEDCKQLRADERREQDQLPSVFDEVAPVEFAGRGSTATAGVVGGGSIKHVPEVQRELDVLVKSVAHLEVVVDSLVTQLIDGGVIAPDSKGNSDETVQVGARPYASTLGQKIGSLRDHVERITSVVVSAGDRLEV
jgi:hypothetical protein